MFLLLERGWNERFSFKHPQGPSSCASAGRHVVPNRLWLIRLISGESASSALKGENVP